MVAKGASLVATCTGQHGIGHGKQKYFKAEPGAAIYAMHALKQALDPQNILIPGTILPAV